MATLTAQNTTLAPTAHKAEIGNVARPVLSALLPLAGFGAANFMAESLGVMPLFFSPAGLPGWVGAGIHLVALAMAGLGIGIAYGQGLRGRKALPWGTALIIGMIAFPFFAAPLDSLQLALVMTGVMMLGLATSIRVARVSRLGGWLMIPMLGWIGFGAVLGLAISAAWAPPFALVTAQNPAPAAI
ncbi:tryptophan-rich sensory protein [Devosia sp. BK]|uniref:tryptophan-rich sensory protein n=1 Tax=Devosia sp. BK TaxID=2871706 RepID=UPI00293A30E2|nr:tryptophan-rich sensory protein [Devosia sp. BK]MDV3252806.1 tryptophan-rich sensory protein [Devosia sp. BK]